MNVRKVLSADEIASSMFSGQREVHVSDSTGRYIVYGSNTCFKSWYKDRLHVVHEVDT